MRKTPHDRYLHRHSVAARILEAIPYDGWVSAAEISAAAGVSPHVVGGLIASQLLGVHVERRRASLCSQRHYLYRRLPRVAAPAEPQTSRVSHLQLSQNRVSHILEIKNVGFTKLGKTDKISSRPRSLLRI